LRDGAGRLDLHHAKELVVSPVQGTRIQAEAAGPVVGDDGPVSVGRVAQVPDRLADLFDRIHSGQHDAGGTQIQDPAEADAGG
jgi:hypothetical protein